MAKPAARLPSRGSPSATGVSAVEHVDRTSLQQTGHSFGAAAVKAETRRRAPDIEQRPRRPGASARAEQVDLVADAGRTLGPPSRRAQASAACSASRSRSSATGTSGRNPAAAGAPDPSLDQAGRTVGGAGSEGGTMARRPSPTRRLPPACPSKPPRLAGRAPVR